VGANIYTPEHRKLTALLRSLREEAGLTQVQLAARLRRSQSFVSKAEAGQRRLDLVDLRRYARAVGSSLPEVVRRFEASVARPPRRSPTTRS
jgi:transcriptional regulator with XRE-family HTH domain